MITLSIAVLTGREICGWFIGGPGLSVWLPEVPDVGEGDVGNQPDHCRTFVRTFQ